MQRREEEEALAADPQSAFLVGLVLSNTTPEHMVLRAGPIAIRAFIKAMGPAPGAKDGNTSLRSLDLCGCNLADDVGVEVRAYATPVQPAATPTLVACRLSLTLLSSPPFWLPCCVVASLQIGTMLKYNKTLRALDLDYNNLGPKTLVSLAAGLSLNRTLRRLSVERNPLTGGWLHDREALPDLTGVAALATALSSNTSLQVLSVFATNLTAAGGRLLAAAIASNSSLVVFSAAPADEVAAADLSLIGDVCRENLRREAEEKEAAAKARDAAEAEAAAAAASAAASAAAAAEEAWLEEQKAARQAERERIAKEKLKKEAAEWKEAEEREAARKARLKAEAEAAAAAGKGGDKKKK